MLRTDPALHRRLKAAAERQGLSLNEFCGRALAASLSPRPASSSGEDALQAALRDEYGENLVGVALFGSAARGELTAGSDLDLLIAIQERPERALYRRWDESPAIQGALRSFDREVTPQFVQLPEGLEDAGSLWLECAVEGRLLWDPGHRMHAVFCRLRRAMLEGRFERATSHGHPYWIRKKAG